MTFEQLDRSIDADSDSEDDMAEQAHAYRSKLALFEGLRYSMSCMHANLTLRHVKVASERAKQQASPTSPSPVSQMAGLSISRSPPPPPRPSASSKPPPPPRPAARQTPEVDNDDDDPFADSNALPTPGMEKSQPNW